MAYSGSFLAILEIMRKHYKPEGLTRGEIENFLLDDYGLSFDRRTFSKAIDEINATEEYRVVSTKGKYSKYKLEMKYALTSEELQLICALLVDTKVLSRLETENIMEKLSITFNASFDTEERISNIIKSAIDNKNEINGLDKLRIINNATENGCELRFKIFNGYEFTDYITDTPLGWKAKSGDLVVKCYGGKYKLSQIYNLDIV